MRKASAIRWRAALGLVSCLAAVSPGWAQQRNPTIGYVFPAGGQRGTEFEVTVGGQYLNGVRGARVSGSGVDARFVRHVLPLTRGQLNRLRQKIRELQRKRQGQGRPAARRRRVDPRLIEDAAKALGLENFDVQLFLELQRKLRDPKRQPNPQLGETVTLRIRITDAAELGDRELRLRTGLGLTNPLVFQIGQFPEHTEAMQDGGEIVGGTLTSLPATLNGQILPGDVDRFALQASKGTLLVARVAARRLIPYLADAVPGWFQATLALHDASGKRVAYVDDYRFEPDPVLGFRVPADGRYVLEIRDAIYRGREDFVYRISLGRIPFVTSVFPLGGPASARTSVVAKGWNLPGIPLAVDARGRKPGLLSIAVRNGKLCSNTVPFALDGLPELREKERNNTPERAQPVELPVIVNGRIAHPGDRDLFRLRGRAGQVIVAEVTARRLDSPLDSLLELTDDKGKQIGRNDDWVDRGAGLITHHADSRLVAHLPADGRYLLCVSDTQGKGSLAHAYRLRLSEERPDFALRVVPSNLNARAGMTVPLTVHVLRKDGFAGELQLGLEGAPPDLTLSGGRVPAGHDKIRLTLTVPRRPLPEPLELQLVGRAVIGGRTVRHKAVPADDRMQAFLYRHLVPAEAFTVVVSGRARFGPALQLAGASPVELAAGGKTWVRMAGPKRANWKQVALELNEPPEGIQIERIVLPQERGGPAILLHADAKTVQPGLEGNLLVNVLLLRTIPRRAGRTGGTRRIPIGVLPAIPFRVVRGEAPEAHR